MVIIDDVLPPDSAQIVHTEMQGVSWMYNYRSLHSTTPNKHWHRSCGNSSDDVSRAGFGWLLPIWEQAKVKLNLVSEYKIYNFFRLYMNSHTFGTEPSWHSDDGEYTIIYYPNMEWKKEWRGGTMIKNELCDYVGNRLVMFPASEKHQAQTVSRECHELRSVVVFKTSVIKGIK